MSTARLLCKRSRKRTHRIMNRRSALSNEQNIADWGWARQYLSSLESFTLHTAQYNGGNDGDDRPGPPANKCETRRAKLSLPGIWCVKAGMFLGRGPGAKWFVLQQPLAATRPMSSGICEG